MGERETILAHLENGYTEPIRDPVWKHIYLSPPLIHLIQCREFQNLHHIKQLGPAYLVYPGATHTRFSHSLGVFHIARKMILGLVKKSPSLDLTLEGVKAFLCAALFHDLGHYPYAHSLKELKVRSHESLTGEKICHPGISLRIKKELGIDPEAVAAIIDSTRSCETIRYLTFYRRLLSGVLDPDKLDYLNRDAYFCGIPYGMQDVDYILDDIQPHPEKGLLITGHALSSVESLLFSKYVMYKTVYWHKTVRIATAMVKKALFLAMNEEVIQPEQLYNLNDHSLFLLADTINYPALSLLHYVSQRRLYKQVYQGIFDPTRESHSALLHLDARMEKEKQIAELLSSASGIPVKTKEVIIDIPEAISFEIDVPVKTGSPGEHILFDKSGSVFTPGTIGNFVRSLRHISLFVKRNDTLWKGMEKINVGELLESG
jgi:uncharacterized protein